MLDQSIADSARPPERETPPSLVGHSVCTQASHDDIREWVKFALAARCESAGWLPHGARGWLASHRPWPDAGLLIGECPSCKSTLAVCPTDHGPECDGTSDEHLVLEVA